MRLYQEGMLERARKYMGMPATSPQRPGAHGPGDANGGPPPPPGAPALRTPSGALPGGGPAGAGAPRGLGLENGGPGGAGLEGLSDVDRRQRELYARQQQLLREQRSADQEKLLACISGARAAGTALTLNPFCMAWRVVGVQAGRFDGADQERLLAGQPRRAQRSARGRRGAPGRARARGGCASLVPSPHGGPVRVRLSFRFYGFRALYADGARGAQRTWASTAAGRWRRWSSSAAACSGARSRRTAPCCSTRRATRARAARARPLAPRPAPPSAACCCRARRARPGTRAPPTGCNLAHGL